MNRKQFVLVLLALCIIGGAGLALFKRNQKTWNVREAKVGELVFPDFKANDVAAIHIKNDRDFWVVRTNGTWRVPARYDYAANHEQINSLLLEMKQLKVMQSEIVGPSLRARVELKDPGTGPGSGTLIEFADANHKVMYSLLLGRRHDRKQADNEPLGMHGWFDGRYVLYPQEPENILLIPNELPYAAETPNGWLDTTFFKVENPKFVGLVSPNPNKNWELVRETADSKWTLNGMNSNESLDRQKLAQATEIWQWPRFVDIVSNAPMSETGLDKPNIITVVTFDNVAYTIKVGNKRPDQTYYMTVNVAFDANSPRVTSPDESADDKKRLDEEFQARKKAIQDKVTQYRAFAPWTFIAEDDWLHVALRDRSELVEASGPTKEASRN
jgi:hypothetical protein